MRARCRDIDVAWFEAGRGDPLILVHGLADDHRAWRRTLPDLMLRHRVVLYDLRGHGETSLGNPDGTLGQLGADLVALLDALDIDRAQAWQVDRVVENPDHIGRHADQNRSPRPPRHVEALLGRPVRLPKHDQSCALAKAVKAHAADALRQRRHGQDAVVLGDLEAGREGLERDLLQPRR